MDALNRILAQLRTFWAGLSTVRRVLIVGVAAAVFLGLGAYAYLNQSGGYVPLNREPTSTEETAAIVAKMKTLGLPYHLDGVNGVTVPSDRLAEIQVALAGEGIPVRGGKGFELFDESDLTSTPFKMTVNYQRALQAELGRAVGQIQGVAAARVLIARPDPSPFVRDQAAPTASVVLKLKPNTTLSKTAAAGVVSLVSRAVVGLKPENVTVVDSDGRLLSDPHAAERDSLPTGQIEYVSELERYLSAKAQEMLVAHLGPGRAVVRVSADVNFQKVKERQERYSPDEKVPLAERLINTSSTGGRAGGVVGTASNVRQAGGGGGGSGSQSKEETIQTDYAVSKTVREMEDRMGAVRRLTIAVLADLTPPPTAEGQPARASITIEDAQEIVKQAVGFTPNRDVIKLSNVPLGLAVAAVEPDEQEAQVRRIAAYVALARNVSLALAVVMALALVPLFLLRRRRASEPVPLEVAKPDPAEQRRERVERFTELARTDPARAAAVFGLLVGTPGG